MDIFGLKFRLAYIETITVATSCVQHRVYTLVIGFTKLVQWRLQRDKSEVFREFDNGNSSKYFIN